MAQNTEKQHKQAFESVGYHLQVLNIFALN